MTVMRMPEPDGCARDCKIIISTISQPFNSLVEWHKKAKAFSNGVKLNTYAYR